MLLPPMCTQADYVKLAQEAELSVLGEPKDISAEVKATWSVEIPIPANGSTPRVCRADMACC